MQYIWLLELSFWFLCPYWTAPKDLTGKYASHGKQFVPHFQRGFFHKQDYRAAISLLRLGKSYNVIVKVEKLYEFKRNCL